MSEGYLYRQYRGKAMGTGRVVVNGEWITGDLYCYSKDKYAINTECKDGAKYTIPVAADTVGQYTGVKDRNEKDTYEGDILTNRSGKTFVIVPMRGGPCLFNLASYKDYLDGKPVIIYDALADAHTRNFVEDSLSIVGNIIDTPDLLRELRESSRF